MIQVDGSFGEGGGQILRTSVALAALTGKAVEIVNIRAGRSKPGLQAQHLMAVRAAGEVCGAQMKGDAIGSIYLSFEPEHAPKAGDYRFDIGTAGATTLVAQTVLLPLALADTASAVTIKGGTHNPHAPTADYLQRVYLPTVQEAGIVADADYSKAGYYPQGGGELTVQVKPSQVKPFELTTRGKERKVVGLSITSSLPPAIRDRGKAVIEHELHRMGVAGTVVAIDVPSVGVGASATIVAECDAVRAGFSALGERGKPMEKVAHEAADQFRAWHTRTEATDEHLADQLVLPAVLAKGESRWTTTRVTEHLRTVLWLAAHFLPIEYDLDVQGDGSGHVRVSSPGL